jgi:Fe-S cluster assembly protein SufD
MSIQSPTTISNPDETLGLTSVRVQDAYLTELLKQCQGLIQVIEPEVAWVQEIRDRAAAWVRQSTIPTNAR